jgi:autotransporter-associated beta strand protein
VIQTILRYSSTTFGSRRGAALFSLTVLSAGLFAVACGDDSTEPPSGASGSGAAPSAAGQSQEGGGPSGSEGGASGVGGATPSVGGQPAEGGMAGETSQAGAGGALEAGGQGGEGGVAWELPAEPQRLGYTDAAPAPAVTAYVDTGATNQRGQACLATLEGNAGVRVLSGFLKIWQPRAAADGTVYVDAGVSAAADGACPAVVSSDWSGLPLEATDGKVLLAAVHEANLAYVVKATKQRTAEQELAAYLDDRRGKNFSISDGMGPLTTAWRTGSRQTTTITEIAADATTVKYDDQGNNRGVGSATNTDLGLAVDLINATSGDGSTEPAKRYFKYARPYRWTTDVVVAPSLVPAKSSTPTTDGGFISGHTAEAFRDALAMAVLVPQRFQELVTRAAELGQNRINSGMHSPLDVMGGRIQATAVVAYNLNKTDTATLAQAAFDQAQTWLRSQTGAKSFLELEDFAHSTSGADRFADHAVNRKSYRERMTYGFAPIASVAEAATVPKGAEVLLATRFPCLTAEQRRVVLKTTAWSSGYPLMDDAEGWGRLDLFAAADGYGAFEGDVLVTLDAAQGGYCERDVFRNDIGGAGRLEKSGSGALWLSGNNTYAGGTVLVEGTLGARSAKALGSGSVFVRGGTLVNASHQDLQLSTWFAQLGGVLELELGTQRRGGLKVTEGAFIAGGKLSLTFEGNGPVAGTELTVLRARELHGRFDEVVVEGARAVTVKYTPTSLTVRID